MTNKGVVRAVNGDTLTVEFERHEACGDCHACMHGSMDCAKHTITIKGKADVGDEIVVEMDESHVMAASATAYMIPCVGFMAGLFAGWALKLSEPLMALCAIAGTAAAYLVMRVLDPHLSKGRWEHKIVSVRKPKDE
ncbi:MAG: SoxR reducing system RseC family protein [Clostridia bacterium]|nr:SoxR reducing system RseC family protein [Clostridia bacterium]MBQ2947801.1 SoxR reducing system RseC family protein [Clostridia bacterium]MBQ4608006.1 SoxR reducing system RseC family protein [Clostridia bacterium]MBQ6858462.1 SoxR reducing system RseC family protein [Clostridia bacterium]MBQ7051817.1 SoxR reducing system RseC family protein [Clostridia bacterium]